MHVRAEVTWSARVHRCLKCNVAQARERGGIGDQSSLTISNVILLTVFGRHPSEARSTRPGPVKGAGLATTYLIIDLTIELDLRRRYAPGVGRGNLDQAIFAVRVRRTTFV
jgi:hypothetical protein